LYVHAKASLLSQEDKEFEKVNKRVNKIFNHTRNQFESLEKYNQYLENRNEIAYKLYNKIDVVETEAIIASFELNNRQTISQNNQAQQSLKDKNAYIIEEFKRLSSIRVKRERLFDEYYRSYIDEKEFSVRTQALFEDKKKNLKKVQFKLLLRKIKLKILQDLLFILHWYFKINKLLKFPEPVAGKDMTLEKARKLNEKKLNSDEAKVQSKEAGGWSINLVMSRYKEYAFSCLFNNNGK